MEKVVFLEDELNLKKIKNVTTVEFELHLGSKHNFSVDLIEDKVEALYRLFGISDVDLGDVKGSFQSSDAYDGPALDVIGDSLFIRSFKGDFVTPINIHHLFPVRCVDLAEFQWSKNFVMIRRGMRSMDNSLLDLGFEDFETFKVALEKVRRNDFDANAAMLNFFAFLNNVMFLKFIDGFVARAGTFKFFSPNTQEVIVVKLTEDINNSLAMFAYYDDVEVLFDENKNKFEYVVDEPKYEYTFQM